MYDAPIGLLTKAILEVTPVHAPPEVVARVGVVNIVALPVIVIGQLPDVPVTV